MKWYRALSVAFCLSVVTSMTLSTAQAQTKKSGGGSAQSSRGGGSRSGGSTSSGGSRSGGSYSRGGSSTSSGGSRSGGSWAGYSTGSRGGSSSTQSGGTRGSSGDLGRGGGSWAGYKIGGSSSSTGSRGGANNGGDHVIIPSRDSGNRGGSWAGYSTGSRGGSNNGGDHVIIPSRDSGNRGGSWAGYSTGSRGGSNNGGDHIIIGGSRQHAGGQRGGDGDLGRGGRGGGGGQGGNGGQGGRGGGNGGGSGGQGGRGGGNGGNGGSGGYGGSGGSGGGWGGNGGSGGQGGRGGGSGYSGNQGGRGGDTIFGRQSGDHGKSGSVHYGSVNNFGKHGTTGGDHISRPPMNLERGHLPSLVGRREDPRFGNGRWRTGYHQYWHNWRDDCFWYPYYCFSPFSVGCTISPWYWYPMLPGYIVETRVVYVNNYDVDWGGGRIYNYDSWNSGSRDYDSDRNPAIDSSISALVTAFEERDKNALDKISPARGNVAIFVDGRYSYSLSADDFYDLMTDNVMGVQTRRYVITGVRTKNGEATVTAKHEFIDADGNRQTVYHRMRLRNVNGDYVITDFMSSDSPMSW